MKPKADLQKTMMWLVDYESIENNFTLRVDVCSGIDFVCLLAVELWYKR